MKFKATLTHYNDRKGTGICRATDKCNEFLDLPNYLMMLNKMATEFAYESGVPLADVNAAIQQVSKTLANVELREVSDEPQKSH